MTILSVLIPFYHDDPSELIEALKSQASHADTHVWLYDDGTGDAELTAKISAACVDAGPNFHLITATQNKGRSAARNALKEAADTPWILFLDADMMPQSSLFLQTYIDTIRAGQVDVIFGGFNIPKSIVQPDTKLHYALSAASDCLTADERESAGAQYVCSSNLCVRKPVLEEEGFDPKFTGWGWEDSEWAARVAERFRLKHIDNPADHLGLENTNTLLRRFKDSAPNYLRFTKKHPELATNLKLFRTSQTLKRVPAQGLLRPVYNLMARLPLPLKLRVMGLKLWRASWYADAFKKAEAS